MAQAQTELQAVQKHMSKFEWILVSSLWMKLRTMFRQSNLVTEARNATLDVERDDTESLINDIQQIREQWDAILTESKLVAQNISISLEFSTYRNLPTKWDAKQHSRVSVFLVITDYQSGLTRQQSHCD
ncbi:hypothetical protein KIL84_001617 [Mauremys mutica]|uniref:Uncharacterized protein n=1 Tax=Mauremys mutica TaxID=74926 RepID=A0A9D3XJX9_9SAUR|nr:hypothetical protein KIL84_001617 [Mauremys mutica]